MTTEPTKVIMVHPDSVNLADVKAVAAQHGAEIRANEFCPLGRMYVIEPGVLRPRPIPELQIQTHLAGERA